MIVHRSDLTLQASHLYQLRRTTQQEVRAWVGQRPPADGAAVSPASRSVGQEPAAAGSAARAAAAQAVEREATTVSATGSVTTTDGRAIGVAVDVELNREVSRTSTFRLVAGDAAVTDPLMLSLTGAPGLGAERSAFDLDGDGGTNSSRTPAPVTRTSSSTATATTSWTTAASCSVRPPATASASWRPTTRTATAGSTRPTRSSPGWAWPPPRTGS